MQKITLCLIIFAIGTFGCAKKEEETTTNVTVTELNVPLVTGDVDTITTSGRLEPTAIDIGTTCSGCSQGAQLMSSFTSGALTLMGIPDALTCMVEALTETQVISGLGDSETYYIEDTSDGKNELTRLNVTVADNTITAYKIDFCDGGSQESHITYTLSNGTASFVIKSQNSSSRPMKITATGNYSNGKWSSKSVDIVEDGASEDGHYAFTQYSDYVSVGLTTDSVQFYGEAALSGSKPSEYALGAGSVKSNSLAKVHFDTDGASTSTESSYSTAVTNASYPSAADVSDAAPSGDQVFSCAIPSGSSATPFSGTTATLTEFQTRFAACQKLIADSNN